MRAGIYGGISVRKNSMNIAIIEDNSNDIVVFDKGRLVQRGSHEELLADTAGKYFEMWNAQAQYYN